MFILVYYCLSEVGLEEGQSVLDYCIPTHFINLRYFLSYALIQLLSAIFH